MSENEAAFEDGDEVYKIVTANRLSDGHVVYLTLDGNQAGWTTRAKSAAVFAESEVESALARAEEDVKANIVVGPYATEITGKIQPLGAKESIRARGGPTIRYGDAHITPKNPDYSI